MRFMGTVEGGGDFLPFWAGAVPLQARRSLSCENGSSEQEGWRPESQRAGDEGHGGEAEGGVHKAAAAKETQTIRTGACWRPVIRHDRVWTYFLLSAFRSVSQLVRCR